MRFKLCLEVNKKAFGNLLPLNYQYEQSAAIYKILQSADEDFAQWLHDNGYRTTAGKNFKLFTFSRFKIEKRIIDEKDQRIRILSDTVEWQISFLPEISTRRFVEGLFTNQTFEIGDKKSVVQFFVRSVEALPSPAFSEQTVFSTMSPMCIKLRNDRNGIDYLSPADVRSKDLLVRGLLDRYEAAFNELLPCSVDDCALEVLNDPKPVLITIKSGTPQQTRVKGYMVQFRLKAPFPLLQLMYESGAGSLCAQGFGCLRVIN